MAAQASHFSWVERDLARALESFQAAVDAGLSDPVFFAGFAVLLQRLGRNDEAYALQMRAVTLDPGNPFILAAASLQLASLLRIDEAIRMADRAIALYPDRAFLKVVRAQVIFNF